MDGFVREFLRELNFGQGTDLTRASVNDKYLAMARTVRHYLMVRWLATLRRQYQIQAKSVAYLSAEFLLGRQLDNALLAADLDEVVEEGLASLGIDLAELREAEVEPGLGNGGLGRLAACFIDSLATMNVPCIGYGIRYEYGIFRQTFVDGWQVEKPDNWLALGSPWEFPHPESAVTVDFGGHTEHYDDDGVDPLPLGAGLERPRRPVQLHGPGLRERPREHPAAVERAGDARVRPGDLQRRRLRAGGARADVRGEHLQGALPGGLDAAGQGAAPAAAVLLRRLLAARLPRPGAARRTSTCATCPSASSSSSTTPTRSSRSPSSCGSSSTSAAGSGTRPGRSPRSASRTPATRCCPRRSRSGRSSCWASCCRGTSRSSTGSTRTSWPSCARPTRTTSCACAACRSSPSTPSGRSGWRTWPRSPGRRSTAWPPCTRSCSRTRCCTTSPTTSRTSSPTSPTASPRAGSCGWPTRGCRS